MSRLQLAINVTDLDKAVEFHSRLFDTTPAKVKLGCCVARNFVRDFSVYF